MSIGVQMKKLQEVKVKINLFLSDHVDSLNWLKY